MWLASSTPGVDWQSGLYYEKRRPARSAAMAQDAQAAERLWDLSAEFVGV